VLYLSYTLILILILILVLVMLYLIITGNSTIREADPKPAAT
jgi:hypothetical protein